MVPPSAGYSGTPLAKKLGIVAGSRVVPRHAPKDFRGLLAPLPENVTFGTRVTASTDLVHLFSADADELERELRALRAAIRSDGVVWVSWPKKSSKVPTDITEDTIRAIALPLGFVDIKVCAVSDVWSGLKLVIRKTLR
jgi:hypothetical protein